MSGYTTTSPFQFGTLATDDHFIDRVEDRALLKRLLSSHINTMLVSPRRWGKSSLVRKATTELCAEDKRLRVCHLDAFSISSEAEFYRAFASQVIACASTRTERWISDAKRFLTGVVPQVVISDQMTDFMAFDLKFTPAEQDKMTILQLPEMIARDRGLRIIVCIDEFQQLATLPEYADMQGKMRSVWQQQQLTTYCLYGSKRSMMLHIFNSAGSPFYRFGQVVFIQKIPREEWVPFITRSFERTERSITPELAGWLCDAVECHSWYLQQLCFFAWTYTGGEATEEICRKALRQVLDINTPMFQSDVERLTPSQTTMLRAISQGVQQLSSAKTKSLYSLGNPNTITKNKRTLRELDLIEQREDGTLAVVDPVFRLWLQRK